HFKWMKENGIDGIALQRFINSLKSKKGKWRNSTTERVMKFSQLYDRTFYIMYDITGYLGNDPEAFILKDFEEVLKHKLKPFFSPGYAKQDGRPVIALWGLGFKDRKGTKEETIKLIKTLKERHGCYVVGGVPYYWREEKEDSKADWLDAYKEYDMLIPWSVGRYRNKEDIDHHYKNFWMPDKQFCDAQNIALQRVIYPGFAWSNLKNHANIPLERKLSRHAADQTDDAPPNEIPRLAGEFFQYQAYRVACLGTRAFIAMFDEFDEATAIAKAATCKAKIPSDQYFLTLDADKEKPFVSADFYLRLSGAVTRMLAGEFAPTPDVPIPYLDYRKHVDHGYRGILGHSPDSEGLAGYTHYLNKEGTIPQFCEILVKSKEFKDHRVMLPPRKLAKQAYQGILERDPKDSELESAVETIQSTGLAGVAAALLKSPEFLERFA
ncbi:MAG: hypothetical protein GY765_28970, partial [bacterium]|nr:hypothetical protein [bacterium]